MYISYKYMKVHLKMVDVNGHIFHFRMKFQKRKNKMEI